MNPVISYEDFTDFLRWNIRDEEKLIPILLIKPVTVRYLNREWIMDGFFDYMDERTGEGIQFFLPGYVHYPNTKFKPVLPDWAPHNENTIAIRINRLGNIHYSNKAFTDFIDTIELSSPNFQYRGDTELLFVKYIPKQNNTLGKIDLENIYRYNLTRLFNSINRGYRDDMIFLMNVQHFLEDVIYTINHITNERDMIERINMCYLNACRNNV